MPVHVGRQIVVNLDLCDFFPTITFPRVRGLFQQLGYSPAVATIFALLSTESPRKTVAYAGQQFFAATGPRSLPQGACTSPALSNLIARRLDSRLSGISGKLGWTFTLCRRFDVFCRRRRVCRPGWLPAGSRAAHRP
jgi:hypothetical protein